MWRQLLTASNAALRVGTGFFAVALAIMTKALLTLLLTLSVSGSSFAAGAKPAWRVEWDKTVAAGGKGAALGTLYVGKLLDPIRPLLLLPDVLDETKWWRRAHKYVDPENKYIFAYIGNAGADDDNSADRRPADKLFNEIFGKTAK